MCLFPSENDSSVDPSKEITELESCVTVSSDSITVASVHGNMLLASYVSGQFAVICILL